MSVKTVITLSEYHDSAGLILVDNELSRMEGIRDAAMAMNATPTITQFVDCSPQIAL